MEWPGGSNRPPWFYFVLFCKKTAFFKLEDIFPECFFNRDQHPQAEPMLCMSSDSCPGNKNCMETLAKRVWTLFADVLPEVKLIILYYRKRNLPGIGGTLFWRSMKEPRNLTINPSAWARVKSRGFVYQLGPSPSFWLTGRTAPPEEVPLAAADSLLK